MVWADGLGLRALDCFPTSFKEVSKRYRYIYIYIYIGVCKDVEALGFHTKSSGPSHRGL